MYRATVGQVRGNREGHGDGSTRAGQRGGQQRARWIAKREVKRTECRWKRREMLEGRAAEMGKDRDQES